MAVGESGANPWLEPRQCDCSRWAHDERMIGLWVVPGRVTGGNERAQGPQHTQSPPVVRFRRYCKSTRARDHPTLIPSTTAISEPAPQGTTKRALYNCVGRPQLCDQQQDPEGFWGLRLSAEQTVRSEESSRNPVRAALQMMTREADAHRPCCPARTPKPFLKLSAAPAYTHCTGAHPQRLLGPC